MGNLTSTLTLRLLDQISGPAKKVSGSLQGLDRTARAAAGRHGSAGVLAGMGGRLGTIATAAAGYGAVRGVSRAVTEYAKADRALTRIGITAEVTRAEMQKAGVQLRAYAQKFALPVDEMVQGLDVLVQTGLSFQESMAFLPTVAATAQATGASMDDIARTSSAMSKSLKVSAKDMPAAFDALAASGKIGNFEIRQMAEHLPRVAASAAKLGFVGVDGAQRLGTMLEMSRDVSGSAESAAVGVADAIEKVLSPTVLGAAKKHGLDFLKIMEVANRNGENGLEAIVKTLMKVTAGMNDVRRNAFLSSIFTEADSRRMIVGLIEHWDEYLEKLAKVQASHGVVAGDLATATADPEAAIQRLSNAWDTFLTSSGKLAYDSGVGGFLEDLNLAIRAVTEGLAQANDAARAQLGSAPGEWWDTNIRQPARAKLDRLEAERHNPALREERQARERVWAKNEEANRLESIIAAQRGNRRVHPAQIAASEAEARRARASAAEAERVAGLASGVAHGSFGAAPEAPSRRADLSDVQYTMGTVRNALDMSGEAAAAGTATMGAFTAGLEQEASRALAVIQNFTSQAQGMLSFSASPTINPKFSLDPYPAANPLRSGGTGAAVRAARDTQYTHSGLEK